MELPPWLKDSPHRPPNDTVGENSADPLHLSVGRLLHTWEIAEQSLAVLFMVLTESRSGAAIRAFGAVIGSGTRCDMIDAAIEIFSLRPDREFDESSAYFITKTARRLAGLRNLVAHSSVVNDNGDSFQIQQSYYDDANLKLFVSPAIYNTKKTTQIGYPKVWYNSATIDQMTMVINGFQNHIFNYTFKDLLRDESMSDFAKFVISKQ